MKRTNNKVFLTVLFLCVIVLNAIGQSRDDYTIDVQHFTVEDGLSHQKVNRVFQDHLGYMWVATKYGLNRYDGHEWRTFTKEKDGLEDNNILSLCEDDQGWLWVGHPVKNYLPTFINVTTLEVLTFEERFPNPDSYQKYFKAADIIHFTSNQATRAIYIVHNNTIEVFQNGQWKSINFDGKINFFVGGIKTINLVNYAIKQGDDYIYKIGIIDIDNQFVPQENIPFQSFDVSKYPESTLYRMYWVRGNKYIEKSYKKGIGKIDFSKFIPSKDTTVEELGWILSKRKLKLFQSVIGNGQSKANC